MKNLNLREKRNNAGITLIALVVTIVVLLILAGVAISMLTGENGIINQAKLAKDKMNEATIEEEKMLNSFEENSNNIKVISKTETSITIEAKAGYTDYQFCIDGNNWTEKQSNNLYTFNNLEKVIVNKTNYQEIKGKEYTIYVKAQKNNENIELGKIKTKTNVEVEVPEEEYYFTYEDLGEEIEITGRRNLSELVSENGTSIDKDENTIMIPSYIDGKPVTKINSELLKSLHVNEAVFDKMAVNQETLGTQYKIYNANMVVTGDWHGVQATYKTPLVPGCINTINLISTEGARIGFATLDVKVNNNGQIEFDENYSVNTLLTYTKPFENIVIPPTVKEIVESENYFSDFYVQYNNIEEYEIKKSNDLIIMSNEIESEPDPDPSGGEGTIYLETHRSGGKKIGTNETWGYTPVYVKILGREDKEEIENIILADEINKKNGEIWMESVYEIDGDIPEYKIQYQCIY